VGIDLEGVVGRFCEILWFFNGGIYVGFYEGLRVS
jgi:hypothetical protein